MGMGTRGEVDKGRRWGRGLKGGTRDNKRGGRVRGAREVETRRVGGTRGNSLIAKSQWYTHKKNTHSADNHAPQFLRQFQSFSALPRCHRL